MDHLPSFRKTRARFHGVGGRQSRVGVRRRIAPGGGIEAQTGQFRDVARRQGRGSVRGAGQPKIRLDESGDARRFIGDVASRKGVVVVSSHLGNIETLAAYGECAAKFHVFMALSISEVFRSFKERHACRPMVEVHPTEGFGMAELFMGGEIVERGDVVLIAGDRGGGRCREMPFLGGSRRFPEGAFRFAAHLERPIYFVASVRERGGYRVFAKLLSRQDALSDYVRELERLVKRYPEQWYQWEDDGRENG